MERLWRMRSGPSSSALLNLNLHLPALLHLKCAHLNLQLPNAFTTKRIYQTHLVVNAFTKRTHLTFAPKKPQPERLQIRLFHQTQDRALRHRDLASIIWKWNSWLWPRSSSQSIASTLIHEDRTLRHQDLDGISEITLNVASNIAPVCQDGEAKTPLHTHLDQYVKIETSTIIKPTSYNYSNVF